VYYAVVCVMYSFLLVILVVAQSVQNLLKRSVKKSRGFLRAHSDLLLIVHNAA